MYGEWKGIETAPKDGTEFLAFHQPLPHHGGTAINVIFFDADAKSPFVWGTVDGDANYHRDWPTHWMPLPAPPVTP